MELRMSSVCVMPIFCSTGGSGSCAHESCDHIMQHMIAEDADGELLP
jgi:hypothetical protein